MGAMKCALVLFSMLITSLNLHAADQTGAEVTKKPVSAIIVAEKGSNQGDQPIGNVQVKYADGTTDLWTTKKDCGQPHVAPDGRVGWVIYEPPAQIAASYTLRPCRTIVLCRKGKVVARIKSENPFIEEWQFQENGARVAVAAMFAHGPTFYHLFDAATGKTLGDAMSTDEKIPSWAKPLHHDD